MKHGGAIEACIFRISFLVVALLPFPVLSKDYQFFTIPGTISGNETSAYGINDAGIVVGAEGGPFPDTTSDCPNNISALVYANTLLKAWQFTTNCDAFAYGINNKGNVVGRTDNGLSYTLGVLSGFVGLSTSLPSGASLYVYSGNPSGDLATIFYGINDSNAVVGQVYAPNISQGIVYKLGVWSPPYSVSSAFGSATAFEGINNSNNIVGSYLDPIGRYHGFMLKGTKFTMKKIAVGSQFMVVEPPGAVASNANGINNAGQIVGFYTDSTGNNHGFLRNVDGSFKTIDYPGGANTRLFGISNNGKIVGGYQVGDNYFAFYANPAK